MIRIPLPLSFGPALLLVAALAAAAQTTSPAQTAPPAAPSAASPVSRGLAALQANQPQQALAAFRQALQANPGDAPASLFAATAALELYQGSQAVQYAEKARQLDPQSWSIHTTLVAAYTEAGMRQQRDQERALLRQLHQTGPADARKANGFLLDMFPIGPASAPDRVEAIEYFQPAHAQSAGRAQPTYRFVVRDPQGHRVEDIAVSTDLFDQKSWAQANPALAAAGERHFQIAGHTASGTIDYRPWAGKPEDYDALRAWIQQLLAAHPLPPAAAR